MIQLTNAKIQADGVAIHADGTVSYSNRYLECHLLTEDNPFYFLEALRGRTSYTPVRLIIEPVFDKMVLFESMEWETNRGRLSFTAAVPPGHYYEGERNGIQLY